MKWFAVVLVLMALLVPILGIYEEAPDFTSRYAQMASPVQHGVDINELLATLTQNRH